MATILEFSRRRAPNLRRRGTDPPVYEAEWHVLVDTPVAAETVLALAQNRAQTDRVPKAGERMRWIASGGNLQNNGLFALDFEVDYAQPPEDLPHLWSIRVTWRAPEPGRDEQPGTIGQNPLARAPEYWIEYYTSSQEVTEGWNAIGIGSGGFTRNPLTRGPITTAAGERVDGIIKDRLKAVLVVQRNVISPRVALNLNNQFEDTINNASWSNPFTTVQRWHARFLRAETSQQQIEENIAYYQMRVMVEIARESFTVNIPNRGILYLSSIGSRQETFRDGNGVITETNLSQAGNIFPSASPITIPYFINNEVNYSTLPF